MSSSVAASYDEVPYLADPIQVAHPDRLAVVARLRGLPAALPSRARVLEMGCADGGHLIPLALLYPDSHFVGIDLAGGHIDEGRKVIGSLGLKNIELHQGSILEIGPSWGEFDYIICHGVFSWVPPEVQDGILERCAAQLTSAGVAYISYNIYPGWGVNRTLRDMMLYHARGATSSQEKLARARQLIDFLRQALNGDNSPYAQQLLEEMAILGQLPPSYLYHEYLEEYNSPLYFHEMLERAEQARLQYLGEAFLASSNPAELPGHVLPLLQNTCSSMAQLEQYMDLLRGRGFRQTLFCRAGVSLAGSLSPRLVQDMHFSSLGLTITSEEGRGDEWTCRSSAERTLTARDPLLRAGLETLAAAFPQTPSFPDLLQGASNRLQRPLEREEQQALAARLLSCYLRGLLDLHAERRPIAGQAPERPVASPWARFQAGRGSRLTDLNHRLVEVSGLDRILIVHLDGRHDRVSLHALLTNLARQGRLELRTPDGSVPDPAILAETLSQAIEQGLNRLARQALLVG